MREFEQHTFNFMGLNIIICAYTSRNKQYYFNNKDIYGQFLYKNLIHLAKEVLFILIMSHFIQNLLYKQVKSYLLVHLVHQIR